MTAMASGSRMLRNVKVSEEIDRKREEKANFHVLREINMPAILVECGFMDSIVDIKYMRDDKYLKAQVVAIALAEYIKLILKPNQVKTVAAATRYSDKGKTHSAYGALERISDAGIITGYSDGTF